MWRNEKTEAKGLCANCYYKQKIKIKCKKCGEDKRIHAKGLCGNCYNKMRYRQLHGVYV